MSQNNQIAFIESIIILYMAWLAGIVFASHKSQDVFVGIFMREGGDCSGCDAD